MLPSPACGRGAGGEGRRWHTDARYFVEAPALTPTPLPQAGEGSLVQAALASAGVSYWPASTSGDPHELVRPPIRRLRRRTHPPGP
ncbi:protein of unknown function [Cupriavidus neocaledonicus]|uniref:Uncharacterized protein n=1 Tax=Cupriavidus neocaledonicus TaxID=1040979 RepID=A0A375HEE5_9BURK|nr:hypothetical protein CBM2605_A10014 [Cupriavidus neocaledonicus]SPD48650.1 protein of unknown function [Cupriavidus neocaledonicus]